MNKDNNNINKNFHSPIHIILNNLIYLVKLIYFLFYIFLIKLKYIINHIDFLFLILD